MTHTIDRPTRRTIRRYLRDQPGTLVLRLLPVGIAVQVVVDLVMGSSAEYFHAGHLLEAWGHLIMSGRVPQEVVFIAGQNSMGSGPAMTLGTAVFFLQPVVALAMIIYPISWVLTRTQREGSPTL